MKDDEGFSGFLYACYYGHIEIVKFFFRNDFSMYQVNNNNFNSFMISILSENL